MHPRLSLIV